MKNQELFIKSIPLIILMFSVLFFIGSFLRGTFLVQKSEKELNSKKQIEEAKATRYSLKEIDSKTGQIRWHLTAKEGTTENNLQGALIKEVKAEVFKNKEVIFELFAPKARANSLTKEIYLLDGVTVIDKIGNFLLKSNQLALGMGTSLEAQKGFNLTLKNQGTVKGENAIINDDQTKIIVRNLNEASFKNIIFAGENVLIERNTKGELISAEISDGGKVILKNLNNDILTANTIKWNQKNEIEANTNIIYISYDKSFKADYLLRTNDGKIYAKNNVLITHGSTKCYGDSLNYTNNSIITVTGHSKAVQAGKQILANKIIYNLNTSKVEAFGNVRTIVAEKPSAKKSEKI